MAHKSSGALGGLLGGGVVDLVRLLSGNHSWLDYSTAFALEAIVLVGCTGTSGACANSATRHGVG